MAKWEALKKWCKDKGLYFRVVTEKDIFRLAQENKINNSSS